MGASCRQLAPEKKTARPGYSLHRFTRPCVVLRSALAESFLYPYPRATFLRDLLYTVFRGHMGSSRNSSAAKNLHQPRALPRGSCDVFGLFSLQSKEEYTSFGGGAQPGLCNNFVTTASLPRMRGQTLATGTCAVRLIDPTWTRMGLRSHRPLVRGFAPFAVQSATDQPSHPSGGFYAHAQHR